MERRSRSYSDGLSALFASTNLSSTTPPAASRASTYTASRLPEWLTTSQHLQYGIPTMGDTIPLATTPTLFGSSTPVPTSVTDTPAWLSRMRARMSSDSAMPSLTVQPSQDTLGVFPSDRMRSSSWSSSPNRPSAATATTAQNASYGPAAALPSHIAMPIPSQMPTSVPTGAVQEIVPMTPDGRIYSCLAIGYYIETIAIIKYLVNIGMEPRAGKIYERFVHAVSVLIGVPLVLVFAPRCHPLLCVYATCLDANLVDCLKVKIPEGFVQIRDRHGVPVEEGIQRMYLPEARLLYLDVDGMVKWFG